MAKSIRAPSPDFYALLQVSPRASDEVIKAAYKALMMKHHPDRGGDPEVAKALGQAHATLCENTARHKYDKARTDDRKVIGSYRLIEEIAEGGFGRTYKGEHVISGAPVCIKHCLNISPEDDQVLIQEANAAWDLRHYSIPAMRDLIRLDDGSLALVMSYVPGKTLEQIIETTGKRLDAEHVAWITQRVLNALWYMHDHGVVHGDIKPQNIIIQSKSHMVVLVDFGLAAVKPTRNSTSLGFTPYYAPPEEQQGKALLPESDFYSLGMTMIFALSGGHEEVKRKQIPSTTPDELCDFIKKLIVRDVLQRPNKAEQLLEAIQEVRQKAFKRTQSGMKPIPGIDD